MEFTLGLTCYSERSAAKNLLLVVVEGRVGRAGRAGGAAILAERGSSDYNVPSTNDECFSKTASTVLVETFARQKVVGG